MSKSEKKTSPPVETVVEPKPQLPSETVRTVISLLIFVHLFCLSLALATGTDSGGAQLLQTVKLRTPLMANYLAQFWLDHGYDYHLMYDQPLDWDYQIPATIHYGDGKDEKVVLPPEGLGPGERRQRYQRLAWFAAFFVNRANEPNAFDSDAARKLIVPASIGAGLLKEHQEQGARSVELGCVYRNGISRDQYNSPDEKLRDPLAARYLLPTPASGGDNPKPLNVLVKLAVIDGQLTPQTFEPLPSAETAPVRGGARKSSSGATSRPAKEPSQ